MMRAHNIKSHLLVREYFDMYPLYSSKRLNFLDWCKTGDIIKSKEHLVEEGIEKCKILKDATTWLKELILIGII